MKTIAYLDCVSGVSGDMCLAALIDGGVPLDYLQTHLSQLGLDHEFTLTASETQRQGQRALKAHVHLRAASAVTPPPASPHGHDHSPGHHHSHDHSQSPALTPHRHLATIEALITQANLPDRARRWSLAVFRRLAEAEAAVHGIAIDQVHFHEVGATDAIVDIVGTCLGLDYLDIDTLVCSPLPTGQGQVKAAHGWLPVPAPAVLQLLAMAQAPLYSNGLTGELVTPTGAALVTTLAQGFGPPPAMTLQRVGLGAGGKDFPLPNVLRLWLGEVPEAATLRNTTRQPEPTPGDDEGQDTVVVLETQVDDMVPQGVGYLQERLFAAGALDMFTQPIAMKKNRPGLLITVLCQPADETTCTDILFAETPTLGVRRRLQQRALLSRRFQSLETPYGPVALKLAYHPRTRALVNLHPEYEDCAALARRHGVPWQQVYQVALSTWYSQHGSCLRSPSP